MLLERVNSHDSKTVPNVLEHCLVKAICVKRVSVSSHHQHHLTDTFPINVLYQHHEIKGIQLFTFT